MQGYTTGDVAELLDLSPAQIRSFARDGFLSAERQSTGEYRYTFQDIVLLRAAKELHAARIAPRKIRRALRELRNQLPQGRPLSTVRIRADGDRVTVRHAGVAWHPESGQTTFDFEPADLASGLAPAAERVWHEAQSNTAMSGDDWFELGLDIDAVDGARAADAYSRALAANPEHADAHVNLGRLHQEQGAVDKAEYHYRAALRSEPQHLTANFNLGTVLEDLGHVEDALRAYQQVLTLEPAFLDAHFNSARLFERLGERDRALQHLRHYQKLSKVGPLD